jgi:hypothetical protein
VQLIMETEGTVPDVINEHHQLNPDIRLVRNIYGHKRESSHLTGGS